MLEDARQQGSLYYWFGLLFIVDLLVIFLHSATCHAKPCRSMTTLMPFYLATFDYLRA